MSRLTGNRSTRLARTVLCTAQFAFVLDTTMVTSALPTIGADLGFTATQLPWVITAYGLVVASLLILGGRAADRLGAGRMFSLGLALFAAGSLVCALAWTPEVLLTARVVQGAGGALLAPAALAALSQLGDGPEAWGRALGWWTAAGAAGGALGWILGGVVTELAGWRFVFAVNVALGTAALLLGRRVLPRGERKRRGARTAGSLDLGGVVTVSASVALVALGLARVSADLTGAGGWVLLGLAVMALLVFVRHERRAADPLLSGTLVGSPGVLSGNLTAAAVTGSTAPAVLAAMLYLQETVHLSPARASLIFPVVNLAAVAGSLLAPGLIARRGTRAGLLGGFGAVTAGIALLLALPAQGVPVLLLLTSLAVMGAGLGAASVASTTIGTVHVPGAERGIAAGLLTSSGQLGQALGVAAISPLVASIAPMTGYRLGFAAAALIAVAGAISSLPGVRGERRQDRDGSPGTTRRDLMAGR